MCIAILKTKDGIITDKQLENSFYSNSDGAGIAYTKDNKLHVIKGIFDVDEFIKTVRQVEELCDNNMLIHCRIGTSGLMDETNCHPHIINDNLCMIHNGMLDIEIPLNSKVSDTILFIEKYLKVLPDGFYMNEALIEMMGKMIGHNKFVFLDNNGNYAICNEDLGHWNNGCWFSNNSYKTNPYDTYAKYYWNNVGTSFISKKKHKKVLKAIDRLNIVDFETLGDSPCINPKTMVLYPNEFQFEYELLEDYDIDAYEDYLNAYYNCYDLIEDYV